MTARLVSHSPNLRLWDGAGNRLHVGDTMETFMVQAATPSPSVGGSEVAYQIVGPTNDVRRTIHIHVTAWDMWNTGLSFNFATNAHAIDAINLRHGYATNLVIDYTLPEWEAPTNHAAVPARNEPACWIAGTTPLVKGRFVVRPTDITNAVLHADHSGTILSAIPPTSVVLSNGVTRTLPLLSHPDHVSFPLASPIPTVVSRSTNEVWTWRAESLNGHDVGDALIATNGPSIAYSILGAPVAPWTDIGGSQTNVWTSALDFVITNACEGATSETNALAELTQFLFSGHGLEYDKDSGDSSYTSGTAGWFDVTGYVNKSAKQSVHRYPRPGNVVNCYDQAAALTIFGRVIGIDSQYRLQQPFGYLNMVALVGIGDCNNPFYKSDVAKKTVGHDDSRTSFRNHAFVTFGVNVFDACGGPETGINTLPIYLNNLIDRSTLWESASAAPTNAVPFTFDFLKLK